MPDDVTVAVEIPWQDIQSRGGRHFRCQFNDPAGEHGNCRFSGLDQALFRVGDDVFCLFHIPENARHPPYIRANNSNQYNVKDYQTFLITAYIGNRVQENKSIDISYIIFNYEFLLDSYTVGSIGCIIFDGSIFSNNAYIRLSNFDTEISFENCVFLKDSIFSETTFRDSVNFDNCKFHGLVDFSGHGDRICTQRMSFRGTKSLSRDKEPRFVDQWFGGRVDFTDSVFHCPPDFHGARLHPGTQFKRTDFRDVKSHAAAACFRMLKMEMARLGDREQQSKFFSLELENRRQDSSEPWWLRFGLLVYKLSCNYGRSFARPIVSTVIIFVFFTIIYMAMLTGTRLTADDFANVLNLSLTQVFQPFVIYRTGDVLEAFTSESRPALLLTALRFIAAIHSVLTLGLFATFIVAIRRRFHMG